MTESTQIVLLGVLIYLFMGVAVLLAGPGGDRLGPMALLRRAARNDPKVDAAMDAAPAVVAVVGTILWLLCLVLWPLFAAARVWDLVSDLAARWKGRKSGQ